MSLLTGRRIYQYQWDIIPMTQAIVYRVEELARNEDQPIVAEKLKYEWYPWDELIEAEDAEEDDVQTPNYQNLAPTGMAHAHRARNSYTIFDIKRVQV